MTGPKSIQDLFELREREGLPTSSLVDMSSIDFPYLKRNIDKIGKKLGTLVQGRPEDAVDDFVYIKIHTSNINSKIKKMFSRYEEVLGTAWAWSPERNPPFIKALEDLGRSAEAIQESADEGEYAMNIFIRDGYDPDYELDEVDEEVNAEIMDRVLAEMESELDVIRRNYNQLTKKRRR